MNLLSKIARKLNVNYRRYILKEPFLLEVERWFKDKGDETLRLNYPLNHKSVVFDVGGYKGDFAAAMHQRYGCKVYVFEPVPEFYQKCVARFQGNANIICLNYGLSDMNGFLDIGVAENASSFASPHAVGAVQQVQVRSIIEAMSELKVESIDLIKINIEGGEFDVLPALIESRHIQQVQYLQVQFHNFVPNADKRREDIRHQLANTHSEMWNYMFVWESWKLKGEGC